MNTFECNCGKYSITKIFNSSEQLKIKRMQQKSFGFIETYFQFVYFYKFVKFFKIILHRLRTRLHFMA